MAKRWVARRGNLMVTSFVLILSMTAIVAGINTMLKEQVRQGVEIRSISLAKLQTYYLAEMGLNHVMFEVNRGNLSAATPTFPVTSTGGAGTVFNFKNNVEMVRDLPTGVAECTVIRRPPIGSGIATVYPFQVQARLVNASGTFRKVIDFTTRQKGVGRQFMLVSYTVSD